jgi:alginate O-acetyltransferase complex protein AlgI
LELLRNIFGLDIERPLLFTQFFFWGFYAAVLGVFSIIHPHRLARNSFLFLVSIFFYYKTGSFFFVLLLSSTIIDYFIGLSIHRARKKRSKLAFLIFAVVYNLLVLSYFKYSYFFTDSFNDLFGTTVQYHNHFNDWMNQMADLLNIKLGKSFPIDRLIPPVGVSFFTFQTISYAIDVYRGDVKPVRNILDFGFFVSYFPQLVAGPIVRAAEFIPQIYQPYHVTKREFGIAIVWVLKGLIKKLILADFIAVNFVDRIFANPELYTGFENLMGIYGYSLQVYGDFSGYTDIAIGISLLMGFRLPVNFNSPYKARSVAEFWRRWHISLSTWLRDYLYKPLGGNKGATWATWGFYAILPFIALAVLGWGYLPMILMVSVGLAALFLFLDYKFPATRLELAVSANLLITMLLGGFWHGASWMFIIWAALNGSALVIYKYWKRISPYEGKQQWYWVAWSVFFTFSFISFTRIWFRAPDLETANALINNIIYNFGFEHIPAVIDNYFKVFFVMYVGLVLHWAPGWMKEKAIDRFVALPLAIKTLVTVVTVFVVYQALSSELQPFIYFQF